MPRNKKSGVQQQLQAIRKETDNPAIISDVTDTEFGVIPESVEAIEDHTRMTNVQRYVTRNSVDGKTWNEV